MSASTQGSTPTLRDAQHARSIGSAFAATVAAADEASGAQAPTPEAAPADKPAVKKTPHIEPGHVQLAEYALNSFFITAPADSIPSDFDLNPAPFDLIAENLTRFSKVTIVHPAGLWYAEGVVVDQLAPSFAVVRLTQSFELPPRESAARDLVPAGFIIRQGATHEEPWLVIRKSDGVVMNGGAFHQTFEQARSYLLAHATVARPSLPKMF